jgi:ABC-type multidrug transport system ATPase subunit
LEPQILLLDEPTSGLDSASAAYLVDLLKSIAISHNMTIISSIHQPSSQTFMKFDRVMLLSHGRVAYQGDTARVPEYFAKLGFDIPLRVNPADFVIELINTDFEAALSVKQGNHDEEQASQQTARLEHIVAKYKRSYMAKEVDILTKEACSKKPKNGASADDPVFYRNFFYQTAVLIHRTLLLYLTNPLVVWVRVIMCK